VVLILEVTAPQPMTPSGAGRCTFRTEGGGIGRDNDNFWVLPHAKVSGRHAVISHVGGVFYIEDQSRNGICLNVPTNRLVRGQRHALATGDRILIDPYEIRVSVARDDNASGQGFSELSSVLPSHASFEDSDPFRVDGRGALRPIHSSGLDAPGQPVAGEVLDPLDLLGFNRQEAPRKGPSARSLDFGSPLDAHYQPPAVVRSPSPPPARPFDPIAIPQDYDPLAPDDGPSVSLPFPVSPKARVPAARQAGEERARPRPVAPIPAPPPHVLPDPPGDRTPPPTTGEPSGIADLAAVLAGAGLSPADVTPDLARNLGQILRVVVSGVLDVMRSRQQIKDEFRMRMTQFKPAENNPLKFSANVDDALHNLLVKRNPAYLGPVEAFDDAFVDLRNHQVAMLAGMRMAFTSMLDEFDPDRMQQEFDRQLGKGLVPAKMRYWDLYRDRRLEMANDPEASFRRLFGEQFARAYEDQLKKLKARKNDEGPSPQPPRRPGT
jgi:type VI secretion system FHA domain protein